ncbi:chaperone modulator CbpM [Undibacterium sp. Rencai35W]|uniref:chaperone modulator CbpM n=1 Tax=Undibacterium sp. Rencai35W TaxID=3413046 RepID=UPI003BF157BB
MITSISDLAWIDNMSVYSENDLIEISGLSGNEIQDLIENELIKLLSDEQSVKIFSMQALITARNARRIRDDFELDRNGMVLAVTLMRRISELENQITSLRAKSGWHCL